jgi:hypothetical protein
MERSPLRTPAFLRTRIAFIPLTLSMLAASAAPAQMVIDEISITSGPAYSAGSFTDFFIDPHVQGSGISSVTLTSQFGGFSQVLFEVTPGEFNCDEPLPSPCEDLTSLAEITALGDLTFTFVGDLIGENDSVVIPLADYDPGAGQVGFPGVVFPTNGATDVPSDATLEWTAAPAWVDAVAVSIEDLVTGDSPDDTTFFGDPILDPPTETSWAPSGMVIGASYLFELSFFEAIEFEDPRMTIGARDFTYTGAFESFNESVFTVPEPGLLALNAAALLTVFTVGRRRARSRSEST